MRNVFLFLSLLSFSNTWAEQRSLNGGELNVAEQCRAFKQVQFSHCRQNQASNDDPRVVLSSFSSDCGSDYESGWVVLSQVAASPEFPAPHQKCAVSITNKDGSRADRYILSLGTSLEVNAANENAVITVRTPSGQVTCAQMDNSNEKPIYKKCVRQMNGETQSTKVPNLTQIQVQQLLAKKLLLTQISEAGARPLELRGAIIDQ